MANASVNSIARIVLFGFEYQESRVRGHQTPFLSEPLNLLFLRSRAAGFFVQQSFDLPLRPQTADKNIVVLLVTKSLESEFLRLATG